MYNLRKISRRHGWGLGLLAPLPALIFTIFLIISCQFIKNYPIIIAFLFISLSLLFLNFQMHSPRLLLVGTATTFFYLLVGNLFLPQSGVFIHIASFRSTSSDFFSTKHILMAAFPALRRTTMLWFGFAWINSIDLERGTKTFLDLNRLLGGNRAGVRIICASASYLDRLRYELDTVNQAIKVHLTVLQNGRMGIQDRVRMTWFRLRAVTVKLFYAIPHIAYSMETHFSQNTLYKNKKFEYIDSIKIEKFSPKKISKLSKKNFKIFANENFHIFCAIFH